jgi:hypothetical protein
VETAFGIHSKRSFAAALFRWCKQSVTCEGEDERHDDKMKRNSTHFHMTGMMLMLSGHAMTRDSEIFIAILVKKKGVSGRK